MSKKITILIPACNEEKDIESCLKSVSANTYENKEIIAINDGSADNTKSKILQFKDIKLIDNAENEGIVKAIKRGIDVSSGEIIVKINADCIVEEDWLNRISAHFEEEGIAALTGNYKPKNTNKLIIIQQVIDDFFLNVLKRKFSLSKLSGTFWAAKKETLLNLRFWNESKINDEGNIFLELKNSGKIIYDKDLVIKGRFPETLGKIAIRKFRWGAAAVKDEYYKHFWFWIRPLYFIFLIFGLIFIFEWWAKSLLLLLAIPLAIVFIFAAMRKTALALFTPLILLFSEFCWLAGVATEAQRCIMKRAFDIILSFTGLIISIPLWLLISLCILFEDGAPIFYPDLRVGKNRKLYKHFKFRSMIKKAESKTGPIWSRPGDTRVTKIGRMLRATAMDELPQLVNILKGDMSFVGPRPERDFFVEKFIKEIPGYKDRFKVRPGLTGMAQVYGKHDTSPENKLKLDLEYIKKNNLLLDIKLIVVSVLITLHADWERFS